MNTEPPVGDELQRMLVSMKQHVLERAESRPRRRRLTGIAIGVVSVLLLGAAGGGVALGLIPTSLTAEPTPTATSTPEQTASETPSGAPVIGRPTPRPTPTSTPTSTRAPYSVADPSTWTISGTRSVRSPSGRRSPGSWTTSGAPTRARSSTRALLPRSRTGTARTALA